MQQNDKNEGFDVKRGFNLLYVAAAAHKATIVAFTRRGFGSDYPGWAGLYGFFLLVAVAGFGRSPALLYYLLAWLVVLALRRAEAAAMRRKGWLTHSYYDGQSFLTSRWRVNEGTAKRMEAGLCLVLGVVIGLIAQTDHLPWLCPLAVYVGLGFVSLAFSDGIQQMLSQRRVQDMMNARLEQEYMQEQFREEWDRYGRR